MGTTEHMRIAKVAPCLPHRHGAQVLPVLAEVECSLTATVVVVVALAHADSSPFVYLRLDFRSKRSWPTRVDEVAGFRTRWESATLRPQGSESPEFIAVRPVASLAAHKWPS